MADEHPHGLFNRLTNILCGREKGPCFGRTWPDPTLLISIRPGRNGVGWPTWVAFVEATFTSSSALIGLKTRDAARVFPPNFDPSWKVIVRGGSFDLWETLVDEALTMNSSVRQFTFEGNP